MSDPAATPKPESMIDRVARGLYTAVLAGAGCAATLDTRPQAVRDIWLNAARAAIEAMREPTPTMCAAVNVDVREGQSYVWEHQAEEIWRQMIDEALR